MNACSASTLRRSCLVVIPVAHIQRDTHSVSLLYKDYSNLEFNTSNYIDSISI